MVFVDMRPILNQGNLCEVLQFFVMNQYALSTFFFFHDPGSQASELSSYQIITSHD